MAAFCISPNFSCPNRNVISRFFDCNLSNNTLNVVFGVLRIVSTVPVGVNGAL